MIYALIALAVIIGTLMPIQAGINAELSRLIKSPFLGAFISFATGTLALGLLILVNGLPGVEWKRFTEASPHLYIGGVLGAIFVGSTIFLIPKMGATTMIASFITGQLLMSVFIDHFGLLGVPVRPIELTRVLGIFLLFAGLLLVVKKQA